MPQHRLSKLQHPLSVAAVACLLLSSLPARSDDQTDQAKAQADYLEQLARQAKANADIAAQNAAAANADASAQLALAKAQTDADKAKLDLLKASIPDFSAYRKDAPAAPNLAATADQMTAIAAKLMARKIADDVRPSVSASACLAEGNTEGNSNGGTATKPLLISDPAAINMAIDASTAIRNSLNVATGQVLAAKKTLDDKLKAPPPAAKSTLALAAPLAVALQFTASIASGLRPNYTFGTQSVGDAFGELLKGRVEAELRVARLDPTTIIVNNIEESQMGLQYGNLVKLIDATRASISQANQTIDAKKAEADKIKGDDDKAKAAKKSFTDAAEELAALVKAVSGVVDLAVAYTVKVNTPDAAGNSPLVIAARGEKVSGILANRCALFLKITPIGAHVDTVVRQPGPLAIFSSLRIWMNSTAMARWQLFNQDGMLVKSDVVVSDPKDRPVEINLYGEVNYWDGKKENIAADDALAGNSPGDARPK